jgi:hypothetical protein
MNNKNQIISGVLFIAVFLLLIFFNPTLSAITQLGERLISSDGNIDVKSAFLLKLVLALTIFFIAVAAITIYFNIMPEIIRIGKQLVDWSSLYHFFLTDINCSKKWLPTFSILVSIVYSSLLFTYVLIFGPPRVEGIMEEVSSLLFLFSGIIMLVSVRHADKKVFTKRARKEIIVTLIASAIALFFIYGEEISWGQRIFSWNTEGVFKEYNWQQETNTHNFFNPLFRFIYPLVGIGSFIVLCFIWFFPNAKPFYYQLFIPHPSLFFITLFMAASTFLHTEIYEQLLALFLLFHTTRIFLSLKEKSKNSLQEGRPISS